MGDGTVVTVTQTLGSPFGSGVMVPGTGMLLNNLLMWADLEPGSPAALRGRRADADAHGAHPGLP